MPSLPATPTQVRQIVLDQFRRLGLNGGDDAVAETILIRDGRYRGRSYRTDGLMAMWMIDAGLIQLYGADGEMLAAISVEGEPQIRRAAA
jgi:hypothetical protein